MHKNDAKVTIHYAWSVKISKDKRGTFRPLYAFREGLKILNQEKGILNKKYIIFLNFNLIELKTFFFPSHLYSNIDSEVHISKERVIILETCCPVRMVRLYQGPLSWLINCLGRHESQRRSSYVFWFGKWF